MRKVFTKDLIFFLFDFFQSFFFGYFENLLTGLFGSELFLIVFLFTFIVHGCIGVGVIIDVDFDGEKFEHLFF